MKELTGGMNGTAMDSLGEGAVDKQENSLQKNSNEKVSTKQKFCGKDAIFAVVMLIIGFLYWELGCITRMEAGVTVFTGIICIATYGYFRLNGVKQNFRSLICLGIIALSAFNFLIFSNDLINALNLMFLSASFVAWVSMATKSNGDNKLSIYALGDVLSQFIIVPFSNFISGPVALVQSISRNKKGKGIAAGVIGIIAFLPILCIVMGLLISADAVFQRIVQGLVSVLFHNIGLYLGEFIIGIPVACYLFGLIYGDVKKKNAGHITKEGVDEVARMVRFAPSAAIYTAMSALNAVYLLFFTVQAGYLFSAFQDIPPGTLVYADYARRGFFELCTIVCINLFVIVCANLFLKRKEEGHLPKTLRVMNIILSVFTVLLAVTALSKMLLYIKYYGLTQLRVYTTWFMVFLLVLFLIILLRQCVRFNASRIAILTFVVWFLVLSYGNVDGMIAKYNLQRFEQGTLELMEPAAIQRLSDGAIPYLYEAYLKSSNEQQKTQLYIGITGEFGDYILPEATTMKDFRDFNLQRAKAEMIRAKLEGNPPEGILKKRQERKKQPSEAISEQDYEMR